MENSGDIMRNNMRHLIKLFEARGNQLDDDEAHDFGEDNPDTDTVSAAATGTFQNQSNCRFY